MKRSTIVKLHATFSTSALLLIASFFISSAVAEIQGDVSAILTVKQLILYGIGILVPLMAATGLSGNKLAGNSQARSIQLKKKRMKWIMILGLTVLTPVAFVLDYLIQDQSFGILFYCMQGIEFIAGGTNIFLIGKNMKEGLMLSGKISTRGRA